MSKNFDPLLRRRALPTAVLALAASTLISACTAGETDTASTKAPSEHVSKALGPEVTLATPMMQRIEQRIRSIYATKKVKENGFYFDKSISQATDEADGGKGTAYLFLEADNAPSAVPGFTGQYQAAIHVKDEPNGTPDFTQVEDVIITGRLFSKKVDAAGEPKIEREAYSLVINRENQGYSVIAQGIDYGSASQWQATTFGTATPGIQNSWGIETASDYRAVEQQADQILNDLVHNTPVDYTQQPLP